MSEANAPDPNQAPPPQESSPASESSAQDLSAVSNQAPGGQSSMDTYEWDYNGQRVPLSRQDANFLITYGAQALAREQERLSREESKKEETPAPQAQADPIQDLRQEIQALKQELFQAKTERQKERIQAEIDQAVSELDLWKSIEDPQARQVVRSLAMLELYGDRNKSPKTAAENAQKALDALIRASTSRYLQGKVSQAASNSRLGGSPPSNAKPFTAKDLHNGNVLKSAMRRLEEYFHASK